MINVRMKQHPYYFLKELKQVLLDAGFVVDGKYIEGLDSVIEKLRPLGADDIVAANQMTLPLSGSGFTITYTDMCWDHDED